MGDASIEDRLAAEIRKAIPGCRLVREYEFSKVRRWRIDIAIPSLKLAIEVEGRQHGRARQHKSDCEKQNALAAQGWRCFRYPASTVLTKKRIGRIAGQISRAALGVSDHVADCEVITGG